LPGCLLFLTFVDLWLLGQHRLVEVGPLRPLIEQSPVLARLSKQPSGTRTVDGFRNLSMLAGLDPISAYRTLDLPALAPLTALAREPIQSKRFAGSVRKAMRVAGVGVRVLDPIEHATKGVSSEPGGPMVEYPPIDDPALACWLFGRSWIDEHGSWSSQFRIVRPVEEPHRAWLLPLTAVTRPAMLDDWNGDPGPLLELFDQASPLRAEARSSQRLEVSAEGSAGDWVIVTQLADPQWQARWTSRDGQGDRSADILPSFRRDESDGGWQRVKVPAAGRWTLHLEYVAGDVVRGLMISALAWLVWGCLLAGAAVRARRRRVA
jgi:hypothetical protein